MSDGAREHRGISQDAARPVDAADPALVPRKGGLFGADRMEAVHSEREEVALSLRRRLSIQRKAEGAPAQAQIPEGGGEPLGTGVRKKLEPKFGAKLDDVRVHTGGESAQAATQLGARAFTVGSDVHFGAGQFAPGTKEGDRLLAHELTHVVQGQRSGIQRKEADGHGSGAGAARGHDGAAGADAGGHGGHEVSQPGALPL